jgi:hypothetical protein
MGRLDETNDPVVEEASRILEDLLREVVKHARVEVGAPVLDWWRSHYKAKFYYALHVKKRTYAADGDKLMAKAAELGTTVAELAGGEPITTLHAVMASFKVDCRGANLFENWCN